MAAAGPLALLLSAMGVLLVSSSGCAWVPRSRFSAVEAQNQSLVARSRALEAELGNLKAHGRDVEDKLLAAEEDLDSLERRYGIDRNRLDNYRRERDAVRGHLRGLARGGIAIPAEISSRLEQIAGRYNSLQYDPDLGTARLDMDILFDTGKARLRPVADQMLDEFAAVFRLPEARDFRMMVVGHTDDRRIVGADLRERYPNNFHLSAARALAVVDHLRRSGVPETQLGMGGFGPHQRIAANDSAENRQRNRRVEIFIVAPDVPVVGWTETTPSLY